MDSQLSFINQTEKLKMKSTLVLLACFIGIAFGAPRNDLQTPEYKVVKTFESDGEKVIKTNEKSAKKISKL